MNNLLHISASPRGQASESVRIADVFVPGAGAAAVSTRMRRQASNVLMVAGKRSRLSSSR